MKKGITGVLGILNKLELTQNFIKVFRASFPDIPLAIGALGCDKETVGYLKDLEASDKLVKVQYGEEGKAYSFSENYNAAINLVETDKMVLIHNDMIFHKDFFKNLERDIKEPDFLLYTTIEPSRFGGLPRPGKVVEDFGNTFSEFKFDRFTEHVNQIIKRTEGKPRKRGYGFFLAGLTQSFKDVGGFDFRNFRPSFCEDDDFQVRLKSKGYIVEVTEQSICYHFVSQTSRETFRAGMSHLEITSNRFFARKWGFEARFLWKTRYEEVKFLRVRDWVILGKPKEVYGVGNIEPLVDFIEAPTGFDTEQYLKTQARTPEDIEYLRKRVSAPDREVDIVISQKGPENFNTLTDIVGYLRLNSTEVKKGTYQIGPYKIEVLKDSSEVGFRVDSENYLSTLHI